MSRVSGAFHESSSTRSTRSVPLSHTSVEIGHLYRAELSLDADGLAKHFEQIRAWLPPVAMVNDASGASRRTSTCLLLDDYSATPDEPPAVLVPRILAAAANAGIRIDYLAREASCAETDGVRPVEGLLETLVVEPPEGATGARPSVTVSGWLCNGVRSPAGPAMAMAVGGWQPPREAAADAHSVFVDVELWSEDHSSTGRRWSCACLAATWQLLRLGLLRARGEPPWTPLDPPDPWPDEWTPVPALTRINADAAPFAAYRSVSVLPVAFLQVELAVQVILGQVSPDPDLRREIETRARAEGLDLPAELGRRVGYSFFGD